MTFQANKSNMNYVGIENMNSLYLEGKVCKQSLFYIG